jgi:hypothetical protein
MDACIRSRAIEEDGIGIVDFDRPVWRIIENSIHGMEARKETDLAFTCEFIRDTWI